MRVNPNAIIPIAPWLAPVAASDTAPGLTEAGVLGTEGLEIGAAEAGVLGTEGLEIGAAETVTVKLVVATS